MLVIVTYDIAASTLSGQRRLTKVAKICTNYGRRVQNSVYECLVGATEFQLFKRDLLAIINTKEDTLRFYKLGNNYNSKVECYGLENGTAADGDLIF